MQIVKNHDDYDSIYWLTGIKTRKDEIRDYKRVVEVKDGTATKTNGHVLISAIVRHIPDGYYLVTKRNKKEVVLDGLLDVDYPETKDLFTLKDEATATKLDLHCVTGGENFFGLASINRSMPEKYTVNWKLFDLITSVDDVFIVDIEIDSPVRFINTTNDRKALLMPMRA